MNDLGMLEVLNDDGLECNETLNTSDELDNLEPVNNSTGNTPDKSKKQAEKVDTAVKQGEELRMVCT